MKRLNTNLADKKKFFCDYVLPSLGLDKMATTDELGENLATLCRHDEVLKMEDMEQPGPWLEGRAWFSERALMHSYYYSTGDLKNWGVSLIGRHKLHLDTISLLLGDERERYVQLLEAGHVYSIDYPSLLVLMEKYPVFKQAIENVHVQQQQEQRAHDRFLLNKAIDRAIHFRNTHTALLHRLPMEIQAMHIKISRGYYHFLIRNGLV